jgi:hypothetical protein
VVKRTLKEVTMTKTLLMVATLIASVGFVVGQNHVPGKQNEAPSPAPPAQQNAPPDKIAPGPFSSPNAVHPDDEAERNAPALRMGSPAQEKLPATQGETRGQGTTHPPP